MRSVRLRLRRRHGARTRPSHTFGWRIPPFGSENFCPIKLFGGRCQRQHRSASAAVVTGARRYGEQRRPHWPLADIGQFAVLRRIARHEVQSSRDDLSLPHAEMAVLAWRGDVGVHLDIQPVVPLLPQLGSVLERFCVRRDPDLVTSIARAVGGDLEPELHEPAMLRGRRPRPDLGCRLAGRRERDHDAEDKSTHVDTSPDFQLVRPANVAPITRAGRARDDTASRLAEQPCPTTRHWPRSRRLV